MLFQAVKRAGRTGRGVRRKIGEMNKTERAYADHLERRKLASEVIWWDFDVIKLRVAPATFYTPDFLVMLADCTLEIHEVKGHWEDDARVKIKVAADKLPFRFIAIKRGKGGAWEREEF
jgi:hypothetical protein